MAAWLVARGNNLRLILTFPCCANSGRGTHSHLRNAVPASSLLRRFPIFLRCHSGIVLKDFEKTGIIFKTALTRNFLKSIALRQHFLCRFNPDFIHIVRYGLSCYLVEKPAQTGTVDPDSGRHRLQANRLVILFFQVGNRQLK